MIRMTIQGKAVSIFPSEKPGSPAIYLNTVSGEERQIWAELQKFPLPDFSLITIAELDWNHDLVPWDHPPIFKNGPACTGGADSYLDLLTNDILPAAETTLPGPPCWRGLAGYSLAGLVSRNQRISHFAQCQALAGLPVFFPGGQRKQN